MSSLIIDQTRLTQSLWVRKSWLSASLVTLLLGGLPSLGQAQSLSYAGPLVITKGGTYTGNYQSLSSGTPCVRIATNEPVVLEGCALSGAGNLIEAGEGANLTVRNCTGQGLTPTVSNQAPGRFLDTYKAKNLTIEHNAFTQTSGIVVNRWSGNGQAGQTLTVRYNRVRNIDGRWRDGNGSTRSSFLILNTVVRLAGVDVSYNEVINTPDQSLVEDNINLYNSSGTAQSAIRVHDNFVRGAYPYPATAKGFTGTGLTTDGDASTLAEATGYIEADHNQFVATANAAMNVAAGHDIYYHDNRAVTSGYLPNGQRFNSGWAAIGVFNYYNQSASVYFNNRVQNNTVGYVSWGSNSPYTDRQDLSPGACDPCTGTIHLPNPITTATEDNEATLWLAKLQQAGLTVGPVTASTPTPTPTPPTASGNAVVNPGFEVDRAEVKKPTGWRTQAGGGTPDDVSYTETYGGAHSGTYHGTHWRNSGPYEIYTYQTLTGLANGTYALSAWVKSSGGQPLVQFKAQNYGGADLFTNISGTNGDWMQVTIGNIAVTNGQCEIGFYSRAKSDQWLYFDDITLGAQAGQPSNTAPTVTLTTNAKLSLGQSIILSATAADANGFINKVEFFNGSTKLGETTAAPYQLTWAPTSLGTYSLTARATDNVGATATSSAVTVLVVLPATATNTGNANVANPGFEVDRAEVKKPTGWRTQAGGGTPDDVSYTETYGGAHSGTYHGTHWRNSGPYEIYTYQTLTGLANGTYALSAWVKSSGGQPLVQLKAQNYGGADLFTNISGTNGDWMQVTIGNITVTNGQCEIGFYSRAKSDQWLYFDDITLGAQAGPASPPAASINSVGNFSFEDDQAPAPAPRQWLTQTGGNTQPNASYSESYPNAHSGTYHGTHYRPEAYQIYTYQTVTGLVNGTYSLSAWVKSIGGQPVAQLMTRNSGGAMLSTAIPTSPDEWMQITISNIAVTNGQCEVGVYSQAKGGQWLYFDDITLVPTASGNARAAATATDDAAFAALYPNPANDQVALTTTVSQAATITITITDLQGTTLASYQRNAVAGENQFVLATNNLASGLYILRTQGGDAPSVQRLEIKH